MDQTTETALFYLDSIKNESSRKVKEKLIAEASDNQLFKDILVYGIDPRYKYHIENVPEYEPSTRKSVFGEEYISLSDALVSLQDLISRKVTGHAALIFIKNLMKSLETDDEREMLRTVISKKMRIGASDKTINKIIPNLIYSHPYCRCSSMSKIDNATFPAYSQEKLDGMYCDIVIEDGQVKYFSRQGNELHFYFKKLEDDLKQYDNKVICCEITIEDADGNVLPREESNGLINSLDHEGLDETLKFTAWDMLELEDFRAGKSERDYGSTFEQLSDAISFIDNDMLRLVDCRIVNSIEEANAHFVKIIKNGGEGTILKNETYKWFDGTSTEQFKMKVVFDCDLRVVSISEGDGKYKGMVGAIQLETVDKKLFVSVGTGLNDKLRKQFFDTENHNIVDKVVKVQANAILEKGKTASLFLPVFIEVRTDKDVADTLEQVKESFMSKIDGDIS